MRRKGVSKSREGPSSSRRSITRDEELERGRGEVARALEGTVPRPTLRNVKRNEKVRDKERED